MKNYQDLITFVIAIAICFTALYPFIKTHNPKIADYLKPLYDIAQALVTQQATYTDKDGAEKKTAATAHLMTQANALNVPLTQKVAEAIIEHAYATSNTVSKGDDTDENTLPSVINGDTKDNE